MLGGFLEPCDVNVAHARLDQESEIDAVARNLVADQAELHRLFHGFPQDRDMNRSALRSLEQVRNIGGAHVVGSFAVDRDNHVAGMNAGLVGRRSDEREDDDDFVVARANGHAHAVVLAALFFAQQRIRLGIEEVGMRVERVQHSRDGPVVDGLVSIDRFGVIVFHHLVNLGELLQAVLDISISAGRHHGASLREQHAQATTGYENEDDEKERTTRTTSHLRVP